MCRLLLVIIFTFAICGSGLAQTSIGFDNPGDASTILDYRLPTWGNQTWSANFGLNGGGSDGRHGGEKSIRNNFSSNLGTNFRHRRESEKCNRTITGSMGFQYRRDHSGNEFSTRSGHDLDANYDVGFNAKRFLADGPFSINAHVRDYRRYDESSSHLVSGNVTTDTDIHSRYHGTSLKFGVGWGRRRDVAPLIRAHRISERLADLGHPRLNPNQIQQMAEIISQEHGYRAVYDRELKHFWDDILAPVLGDDIQLSAFETLYLADALSEEIGYRQQGFSVAALWAYTGVKSSRSSDTEDSMNRRRSPTVEAIWYHNFTMEHQAIVRARWSYYFSNLGNDSHENGGLHLSVGHLWNLADRHLWETRLDYDGYANIDSDSREKTAELNSSWTIYVEDSLSLRAATHLRYYWHRGFLDEPQLVNHGWNWGYSLSMVYHLDRVLF